MTNEDVAVAQAWSLDEENWNCSSLGELIDTYHDDLTPGRVVYVGDQEAPDTARFFDAEDFAERLGEVAYDNHGECAEDWPDKISDKAKEEFNAFLAAWIAKHCPPRFYSVGHIRTYTITAEDLA